FRTATTTTTLAPVPFRRLEPAMSEPIRRDPQLMDVVRQANQLLTEELARGRDHVTAEWKLVPGSASPPLGLVLTGKDTTVSVEGYFPPEDMRSVSVARFALFRLWDELLRKKAAKLLEQAREGA